MTVKYYLVGGAVRDEILGKKSKDLDYSCEAPSYEAMKQDILARGGTIFVESPQYLTIRAKMKGEAADFVLCRKDGSYYDGRRPDTVEVGTLYDDLARRDFTMNAIAKDENGELVDPFNGLQDIKDRTIRCVGKASDRLSEDALRMLRAIRFSITKSFAIDESIVRFIDSRHMLIVNVSEDRIRDELTKCFAHNTLETMRLFGRHEFMGLRDMVFTTTKIWLKPTSEGK